MPPAAPPGASTPSPGTSTSRWPPGRSSGRGWTCGGQHLRRGVHRRIDPSTGDLRAARRGQRLPEPGGQHRVHLPGQRPLVGRGPATVHVPQPRRRDRRHRLAHPPGAGRALGQGPRPPRLARGPAHGPGHHARAGRHRSARPGTGPPARRPPGLEFLGRDRFDLADPDAVGSIDWRGSAPWSTPAPTPPSTRRRPRRRPGRLGGQRRGRRRAGLGRAPSTA